MSLTKKPTERFSDRVENYVKFRPGYPATLFDFLSKNLGLIPKDLVADVGSGTGILTRYLLDFGNTVYAVEPNEKMRLAAEKNLSGFSGFKSVSATAENTTLEGSSVDWIFAAQAFHWFNHEHTHLEFRRILKPGGAVGIIWNERILKSESSLAYEKLLKTFGTDYHEVQSRTSREEKVIEKFFGVGNFLIQRFNHSQFLNYEAFEGRLLSSSYTPTSEMPNFKPMLGALRELFEKYKTSGLIEIPCETKLYHGHL